MFENPPKPEPEESLPALKKLAKLGVLAGGLMGSSALEKPADAQIITYIPNAEAIQQAKNVEHIVPRNVLDAFAQIADSTNIFQASGGYLENNFLYGDRELRFKTSLLQLGYSNKQIGEFADIFKSQSIVFPEDVVNSPEFKTIREHEWMHKLIHDLSPEDKKDLNEARDFLVKDYEEKQFLADAATIDDYKKAITPEEKLAVHEKKSQVFKDSDPILYNSDPMAIFSVIRNPDELIPYLLNHKLDPRAESLIKEKFPKAAKVYENLKNRIHEATK